MLASGAAKVMLQTRKSRLNHGSVVPNHTSAEKEKSVKKRRLGPPPGLLFGAFRRPSGSRNGAKSDFGSICFFGLFSVSTGGGMLLEAVRGIGPWPLRRDSSVTLLICFSVNRRSEA